MATGALRFFNPASILPSPEVAVAPPPVADHSAIGMALFDSVNKFREVAKQKRDLENLRSETNALADYFGKQSPQLKKFLNDKAGQYDLLSTDAPKERAGLLQGAIGLFNSESARIKADKDATQLGLENNWKTKVNGANQRFNILTQDRQRWDAQENDRVAKENANRERMARYGQVTPPPVKQPYPREKELSQAEADSMRLSSMTPEEIRAMATVRSGSKGIIGGNATGLPSSVSSSGSGSGDPFMGGASDTPTPDLPSDNPSNNAETLIPNDLFPPPGTDMGNGNSVSARTSSIPDIIPNATSPSQLTEDSTVPAPAQESESLLPPPSTQAQNQTQNQGILPNAPMPLKQLDAINDLALQNQAAFKEAQNISVNEVDNILDRAERNRTFFEDESALDQVLSKRDAIKDQIKKVPGMGTTAWNLKITNILKSLTNDVASLKSRTAVQEEKQTLAKANSTYKFYVAGGDPTKVFDVVRKVLPDGRIRWYSRNDITDQMDQDVTTTIRKKEILPLPNQDLKTFDLQTMEASDPLSGQGANGPATVPASSSNVNVATPGASLPSIIQRLREKGAASNASGNANKTPP